MILLIGIIKIIGIIILIIAAAVLMLIAAVLFVPLRYHIEGSFRDEKPRADAAVKWMLGILSLRASYSEENGAAAYISLFGRRIYDLLGDDETDEGTLYGGDSVSHEKAGAADIIHDSSSVSAAAKSAAEDTDRSPGSGSAENAAAYKTNKDLYAKHLITGSNQYAAEDGISVTPVEAEAEHAGNAGKETIRANIAADEDEVRGGNADAAWKKVTESKRSFMSKKGKHKLPWIGTIKERIFMSIRRACDKASELIDRTEVKLKELAGQALDMLRALKKAFDKRSGQLKSLKELWDNESYRASKELLMSRIFRLLNEIRPRGGHGRLRLGLGDPYSTGQVMQAAAFLYPFYAKVIDVIPDFDQSAIDGEAKLKGRIRLIIPAEAALRIFLDKGLRRMYKEAKSILELD